MESIMALQRKIVPELVSLMQERYTLLQHVHVHQPIGRRALAESANLTERHVRGEIDFLHGQGLVEVTSKGMFITNEGKVVLDQLAALIGDLSRLENLEDQLKSTLSIDNVIVVPGDSDHNPQMKAEMGKACVTYLQSMLQNDNTVAVTGGSTIAAVAEAMKPLPEGTDILFVPARGGIGEKVENQASRIVSEMARRSNSQYRMLYVPDPISDSTYELIMQEPHVIDALTVIKNADIVIHGVGDALRMAERRRSPQEVIDLLKSEQAVSEAFGYYFDVDGRIVYKVKTVGLQLEDIDASKQVITVAGGTSKGHAITSYFKQGKSNMLITDQGAAEKILRG
ncbi:sugar-binding transcriptional regulator [Oceanobacillus timonensis]|uniref:sugar-binding transcriptional regulator n=1 Tax=Oceanobacillus timonensis TaxID=1926285 RepID=UPI0009BA22A3|nr:sugar-binding domain-containing protein [Oceanobacillus timonensis]